MSSTTPHPSTPSARPTLSVLTRRPEARWRLYCLPPGGIGPEFYLPWRSFLPSSVELCAVQS